MAISMGAWTVSSSTVPIFNVPPGQCSVTFYSQTGTVYTGLSTAMTTLNGMSVSSTPVTFQLPPTGRGAQFYAVGPGVLGYIIASGN